MSGCLGDASKTGPYVTGECQTIELALRELQIHIDTYHEKDLKKSLKCEEHECPFETEYLPNDSAMERLKLHISMKHKPKMERGSSDGGSSNESKQVFKATKCNVIYKKNQSF